MDTTNTSTDDNADAKAVADTKADANSAVVTDANANTDRNADTITNPNATPTVITITNSNINTKAKPTADANAFINTNIANATNTNTTNSTAANANANTDANTKANADTNTYNTNNTDAVIPNTNATATNVTTPTITNTRTPSSDTFEENSTSMNVTTTMSDKNDILQATEQYMTDTLRLRERNCTRKEILLHRQFIQQVNILKLNATNNPNNNTSTATDNTNNTKVATNVNNANNPNNPTNPTISNNSNNSNNANNASISTNSTKTTNTSNTKTATIMIDNTAIPSATTVMTQTTMTTATTTDSASIDVVMGTKPSIEDDATIAAISSLLELHVNRSVEEASLRCGLLPNPTLISNTNPIISTSNQIPINTTDPTKNVSKPKKTSVVRLPSKTRLEMAILYKETKKKSDWNKKRKNDHLYNLGISKFGLPDNRDNILKQFQRTSSDHAKLQVEVDVGNGESRGIFKSIPESIGFVIFPPTFKTEKMIAMDTFISNAKKLTEGNQDLSHISDSINGAFRVSFNNSPKIDAFMKEMKKIDKDTPSHKVFESYIIDAVRSHKKFTNKNPSVESFDLLIQTKETPPQPIHCDIPHQLGENFMTYGNDDLMTSPNLSGIMMLVDNCQGPIIYNMTGIKQPDGAEEFLSAWDDIEKLRFHKKLAAAINGSKTATEKIQEYGILISAKEERRLYTKKLKKHSIFLFGGNIPHHGPGSDGFRAIIFFTVRLQESSATYNDLQMTQEKLILIVYDEVRSHVCIDTIHFLFNKLADCIIENASRGTTRDVTIETKGRDRFFDKWDDLVTAVVNMKTDPSDNRRNELQRAKTLFIAWGPERKYSRNPTKKSKKS